jgi:glucose uptake protein
MFLPGSYVVALVIMVAGMIFWGSWANTYKLTRNWRIELYYWDYAVGIFLTSIAVGLTLGTFCGGTTFAGNLMEADRSAWIYAICAGALWNCGNILLMLGVALVGLAVAFPLSIGLALVFGVIGSYMVMPKGNPVLLFGGVAMVFVAVIFNSLAYRAAKTGGEAKQSVSRPGLIACLVAGVLFSGFGPLVGKALSTPKPLGPYGVSFLFTFGALLSTVPLLAYFMRHPLEGSPLSWADYRRGRVRDHAAGLIGAFFWGLGTTFTFVGANSVGIALAYAIGQANPLVAGLWGVFVWREFKGAPRRANVLLAFMFALYFGGLLVLASSFNAK